MRPPPLTYGWVRRNRSVFYALAGDRRVTVVPVELARFYRIHPEGRYPPGSLAERAAVLRRERPGRR